MCYKLLLFSLYYTSYPKPLRLFLISFSNSLDFLNCPASSDVNFFIFSSKSSPSSSSSFTPTYLPGVRIQPRGTWGTLLKVLKLLKYLFFRLSFPTQNPVFFFCYTYLPVRQSLRRIAPDPIPNNFPNFSPDSFKYFTSFYPSPNYMVQGS